MAVPLRAPCDLLDRAAEIAAVAELLTDVAERRSGCLVVEGPAGIGKTSLLDRAAEEAAALGIRVRRAVGDDLESALPFGLARRLFDDTDPHALSEAAALAAPALTPGALSGRDPSGDVLPLLHGLFSLVLELSDDRPQLLLLDDAQWSDPQTLRFLAYLLNRLHRPAVGVLVANRTGTWSGSETTSLLARVHAHPASRLLHLSGLGPDAVATLVRRRLPEATDGFCRAVEEATTGNPFLCEELVSTAAAERIDPTDEGSERLATLRHTGIQKALLVRLGQLGHDTAHVVAATAVLGPSATVDRVAALSGLDRGRAAEAVDRLVSSGTLAHDGSGLTFVHPIIRETVYGDLGPGRRAASHRAAAEVLLDDGVDPSEVAVHVLAAGERPSADLVPVLRAAASAAVRQGAPDHAVELLEVALEGEISSGEATRVLVELGRAEAACGRPSAIGHFQAALAALTASAEDAGVARDIGAALYAAGVYDEAQGAFERGLEVLAAAPSTHEGDLVEAQLVAGVDMTAMLLGTIPDRVDAPAPDAGDARLPSRARSCLAAGRHAFGVRVSPGHRTAAVTLEHARHALAGPPLPLELGTTVLEPLLLGLSIAGEGQRAREELDRLLGVAVERGDLSSYTSLVTVRSLVHLEGGDLGPAAADAAEAIGLVADLPTVSGQVDAAARGVLARASLLRGDPAAAEDAVAVDDAEQRWGRSVLHGWYLDAVGRVELHRGRARAALDAFLAAGDTFQRSHGPGAFCPWRSGAAMAAEALGDRDRAMALADEELTLAEEYGAPVPLARALRARATLDDAATGVLRLEAARNALDGGPALDTALVEVDLGAALRRAGRRSEARERLRTGLALARRCGCPPLVARAEEELRVAGARRAGDALWGVEALTPAERRVAELAAGGLSNREIATTLYVSRKTVEVHLSACYRKLGIGSRAELAAALGSAVG